jgi:hypothetical protein
MKKHEAILEMLERNVKNTECYFNTSAITAWQPGDPHCEGRLAEAKFLLRQTKFILEDFND